MKDRGAPTMELTPNQSRRTASTSGLAIASLGVLIVDDNPTYRQELHDELAQRYGLSNIACARDGVSGLQWLARRVFEPDLIFVDLHMPRMGGLQFAQLLHARGFAARIVFLHVGQSSVERLLAGSAGSMPKRLGSVQKSELGSQLSGLLQSELRESRVKSLRAA